MIRRPPRSTRTTHSFPTRRSSDLLDDQAAFADTAKLALRHLDLIHSDEPLEEGAEDGGEQDESEAEESQEEQESEDGGAGESQVDARAEMAGDQADDGDSDPDRSEEHTSELQSLMPISNAVVCLK